MSCPDIGAGTSLAAGVPGSLVGRLNIAARSAPRGSHVAHRLSGHNRIAGPRPLRTPGDAAVKSGRARLEWLANPDAASAGRGSRSAAWRRAVLGVRRVIAGVSGSATSLRALRLAEQIARESGALLIPVLAWTPPGGEQAEKRMPSSELGRVWQEAACRRLHDALIAVWGAEPTGPHIQPHVERGPAGWVLTSIGAEPGDVLVLGAGRRGVPAWMVHSRVTRYCVARARCPVVLVPPSELERDLRRFRIRSIVRHRAMTPGDVISGGRSQSDGGAVRA
jgi:nucleotide-binding universal stress UspA family protein